MMFVTLFYAILDPATGRIEFCNSGHNPPAVIDRAGDIRFILSRSQPALGVWEDYAYESEQAELSLGDTLVLYTDGVTEAMNADGAEFGDDRLAAILKRLSNLPVTELVSGVISAVQTFAGAAPQSDDVTCLGVSLNAP
jgi:sigma-B regulation protein RsbU (phosphoserine phosphatase)